ncbi:helix-turn-helix domain-containing protein [Sulfitobacter pontiacus]|uniref:helix-turn-helix domain-containing protein n=1 Tax=Sulfitobacter pontiacus TaxID=60137 RepID=UPI003267CFEB
MTELSPIPSYALFGETKGFPDVLHCERIKDRAPDHAWHIAPHRHAQLAQVLYIFSGGGTANIDGDRFALTQGSVVFIPPRMVHSFDFAPNTQGMVQSFPIAILHSIGPVNAEVAQALTKPTVGRAAGPLIALMTQLETVAAQTGAPFRAQIAVGLGHAVLASIAAWGATQNRSNDAPQDDRLSRLDQLIGNPDSAGWTAKDFASTLGISTGHLSRLCRAAKGLSATAYIEARHVEEACRMLAFTRLTVAEVGYRLGFTDPSYFSRRFRTVQGVTPSQYRQQFVT